jgi:hypothetical protein
MGEGMEEGLGEGFTNPLALRDAIASMVILSA